LRLSLVPQVLEHEMKTPFTLTGMCLLVAAAFSQPVHDTSPLGNAQQGSVVRGEVTSKDLSPGSLAVQLSPNGDAIGERADVNPDGSFEFRHTPPGIYHLSVTDTRGGILYDERVSISGSNDYLSIRLPTVAKTASSGQGTVSIRQLEHTVPADAQKAYNRGQRAGLKGDSQYAMDQFRAALSIDPEFADAYNELGAVQASLGNVEEAAKQFQKAVELVPDHRLALPNLCLVLARLQRYGEAGPMAVRALRIDPENTKLHFILAISLIGEQQDPDRALDHLQRAAPEIPEAHMVAAELLLKRGRPAEARNHLEEYLRSVPADDVHRPRVQALLDKLHE
jgi:tetratricopeptide (TPR) repeat protein